MCKDTTTGAALDGKKHLPPKMAAAFHGLIMAAGMLYSYSSQKQTLFTLEITQLAVTVSVIRNSIRLPSTKRLSEEVRGEN